MTKQECISFIEQTQKSYNKCLHSVKYFEEQSFAGYKAELLNKKEFLIAIWLYQDEEKSKDIAGTIFYNELEILNSQYCEEYNKISNIYLKNIKKSFLFAAKLDPMSKDKAKAYIDDLMHTTEQITLVFNKILTRVHALPDSKFS